MTESMFHDGCRPDHPTTLLPERLIDDYRRLLRWYPADWRRRNGEAMLGALLDEAEAEGMRRADPVQRMRIAKSGIAARLAPFHCVRETATAGVLLGTLLWGLYLSLIAWSPNVAVPGGLGPFSNPLVLASIPWALGLAALVCRLFTVARLGFGASAATVIAIGVLRMTTVGAEWYGPGITVVLALALAGLAAASDRPVWTLRSAPRALAHAGRLVLAMIGVLVIDLAFATGSVVAGSIASASVVLVGALVAAVGLAARRRGRAEQLAD